jgi:hypothetical protein
MGKTEPITNSVRKNQNTPKHLEGTKTSVRGVKKKREGPKEKSSLIYIIKFRDL